MELGSEYNLSLAELNIKNNNIFYYLRNYNCIYTDSGRSALKLIPKPFGEILLPEFICDSVINCFNKSNIRFYNIKENCQLDVKDLLSKITRQTKIIFIMHYFGSLQSVADLEKIRKVADQNGILIIEDTTHSIFSASSTVGDYMITSIRKWMPIAIGGILYSKKRLPDISKLQKSQDNERLYGMLLKDLFLKNILKCNSVYRGIFEKCEKNLEEKREVELLSDLARFIISCMDIDVLKKRRQHNYKYLTNQLSKVGIKSVCILSDEDCPFIFPIRIEDRDKFRKYLMDNKIYCAVHWPFDNFQADKRTKAILNANTLLSLPIDQRYRINDMDYLVEIIKCYGGAPPF